MLILKTLEWNVLRSTGQHSPRGRRPDALLCPPLSSPRLRLISFGSFIYLFIHSIPFLPFTLIIRPFLFWREPSFLSAWGFLIFFEYPTSLPSSSRSWVREERLQKLVRAFWDWILTWEQIDFCFGAHNGTLFLPPLFFFWTLRLHILSSYTIQFFLGSSTSLFLFICLMSPLSSRMPFRARQKSEIQLSYESIHRLGHCEIFDRTDNSKWEIEVVPDNSFEIGVWEEVPVENHRKKKRSKRVPREPVSWFSFFYWQDNKICPCKIGSINQWEQYDPPAVFWNMNPVFCIKTQNSRPLLQSHKIFVVQAELAVFPIRLILFPKRWKETAYCRFPATSII